MSVAKQAWVILHKGTYTYTQTYIHTTYKQHYNLKINNRTSLSYFTHTHIYAHIKTHLINQIP
ncbi:hypothetical protein Hanom_Chr02g00122851 [Helianthus anomalus]